jgi:Secretion system C-terminal sorting domain
MKNSIILLFAFFLHLTIVNAQTLPIQLQNVIDKIKQNSPNHRAAIDRNAPPMCLPDSVKTYTYLSLNDSTLSKYEYLTWDEVENKKTRKIYASSNGGYYLSTEITSIIDEDGFQLENRIVSFQENGDIVFGSKSVYFKNALNNIDSVIISNIIPSNFTFEPISKLIYFYDDMGRQEAYFVSLFQNNEWVNLVKGSYLYGTNGKLSRIVHYNWQNDWVLTSIDEYSYNQVDSLAQILTLSSPSGDSLFKINLAFGALNVVDVFNKQSVNLPWSHVSNYTYILDNKRRVLHENTNEISQSFIVINDYIYGATNEDCLGIYVNEASFNQEPSNILKSFYYYNSFVSTNEKPPRTQWNIAPNPNNGNFEITAPEGSNISIYNSIGQIVWQKTVLETSNQVNLGHFPSGFYSVSLQNEGNIEVKKIVIE